MLEDTNSLGAAHLMGEYHTWYSGTMINLIKYV